MSNPNQWGDPNQGPFNQGQFGQDQPAQGQPSGQGQWGAPNQGQFNQNQPAQGQPVQGQPSGQGQWGAPNQGQFNQNQPAQGQSNGQNQWGQPNQGTSAVKTSTDMPAWPTWVYAALGLLTLLTSFLSVLKFGASFGEYGSFSLNMNWWGQAKATADSPFAGKDWETGAVADAPFFIICTLGAIGLYVAAAVLIFLKKDKIASYLGIGGAALQLIAVILAIFDKDSGDYIEGDFGAGWYLWLLFAILGLAFSIFYMLKGQSGIESTFSGANKSGGNNQLNPANNQWAPQPGNYTAPGQAPQQNFGQPGQNQPGQNQPGQNQQWGQQNQWGQPGNNFGSNG
ncbi:hypothetical protein [Corynebacterium aquatimens]|uniref:Uncharacterized protein n=1 Tax=Corynebacterium aquatimens TaxID=1190508 RepID=A0A931E190_9CORY|nr:hypothetical protein [Corynebacterium aquatimens]MBG6122017.1 hypothetical protein [Corynebacterium aquatimens]WJY65444.1 hypothetical protein CAQUA_03655 [Corynebacterium aquatimens]